MKLEYEIMQAIGLGREPGQYARQTCRAVRQEAVNKLTGAINTKHAAGAKIIQAHKPLIDFARYVANKEGDGTLKLTWGVCIEIIFVHMLAYFREGRDRQAFVKQRLDELKPYYEGFISRR